MGLFGDRDVCPICGEPVPRLLPTKIDGQAICKECDKKKSAQPNILAEMTLEDYKKHLEYREKNAEVLQTFNDTRTVKFLHTETMHIDDEKQLFYVGDAKDNPPVFKFSELKAFRFVEKLGVKTNIVEDKNKYRRAVINYSKDERKRRPSYVSMISDHLAGVTSKENFWNSFLGVDDEMIELEKPFKYFRLVFVLKNPYWKKPKLYYLTPRVTIYNTDSRDVNLKAYLMQCEDIIADAENLAVVMESILDYDKYNSSL